MATKTCRALVVCRQARGTFVDRMQEVALRGFAFAEADDEAVQLFDPVFHGILRERDWLAPLTVWIYSNANPFENQAR